MKIRCCALLFALTTSLPLLAKITAEGAKLQQQEIDQAKNVFKDLIDNFESNATDSTSKEIQQAAKKYFNALTGYYRVNVNPVEEKAAYEELSKYLDDTCLKLNDTCDSLNRIKVKLKNRIATIERRRTFNIQDWSHEE